MIEQEEFLEIIKLLEENYNKKLPDSIVGIWYDEFKTFSLGEFKKKVIESIKEYSYFPTINQVKNIQDGGKELKQISEGFFQLC